MPASGNERFCGSDGRERLPQQRTGARDEKQFPAGHDMEARISLASPASKYHFQGHLHNARRARAGDTAEIAVDDAGIGIVQLRVIQRH